MVCSAPMSVGRTGRDLLAVGLLAGVPLAVALRGSGQVSRVTLNLGPGDSHYIRGFFPEYDISRGNATQWSLGDASITLPLTVSGGPLTLVSRFSRPIEEEGDAAISFGGALVDRFTPRRITEERRTALGTLAPTPFVVRFQVTSPDARRLGLRLDWIRLETEGDSRVRLQGSAVLRPSLLLVLLYLILRFAGWNVRAAALLSAPWSAAVLLGLTFDPWLVHRLLTALPEWLAVLGLGGVAAARAVQARGRLEAETVRVVTALAAAAFLFRGAAFNHPEYYYSDLRTHAKLVHTVRMAGSGMLFSPGEHIVAHGAWSREINGRVHAFPYTPAFHAPFAMASLSFDDLITALKLGATAATVVPILALWSLCRRCGASTLGVFLMLAVPIYVHHLGLAYLAALFGHAVDMAFLAWLAGRVGQVTAPRVFLAAAALTAACQLAYVGAVIVLPVFLTVLAAFVLREDWHTAGPQRSMAILAFGVAGSLIAVAVYYRHFLPLIVDVFSQLASGGRVAATDDAPKRGFLEVLAVFTRKYFDGAWTPVALWGLFLLLRRGEGRPLVAAWGATYLLLLLGRARLPFIFQHPHDALFVTPLVCLAAGEGVAALARSGGWRRVAAALLLGALVVHGFALQWQGWARHIQEAL